MGLAAPADPAIVSGDKSANVRPPLVVVTGQAIVVDCIVEEVVPHLGIVVVMSDGIRFAIPLSGVRPLPC